MLQLLALTPSLPQPVKNFWAERCTDAPANRIFSGPIIHLLSMYWAIQAGLLTPLTFAQHCLSPLAAFTSGAYFLHNGRR